VAADLQVCPPVFTISILFVDKPPEFFNTCASETREILTLVLINLAGLPTPLGLVARRGGRPPGLAHPNG
jgi:hypothetical protein